MRTLHRRDDRDDEDYTRQRRGSINGHTRWAVGVVSLAVVAALGAFASSERTRLEDTEALARNNDKRLEVLTTSVDLRLETIEHHVEEIRDILRSSGRH